MPGGKSLAWTMSGDIILGVMGCCTWPLGIYRVGLTNTVRRILVVDECLFNNNNGGFLFHYTHLLSVPIADALLYGKWIG